MTTPAATLTKGEQFVKCCSCFNDKLKRDHGGISCAQGHHLCPGECSKQFVRSRLGQGPINFLKCPMKCGIDVTTLTFEKQLTTTEKEIYLSYTTINELQPGERLKCCPHCDYFEIWPVALNGMDMFFCRKGGCSICTCAYCEHDVAKNIRNGYNDEDYEQGKSDPRSFMYHMECAELAPLLQKFKAAIEEGVGTKCPGCGLIGRKDEACTHMICPKCKCSYCYLCGKKESDCDKENPRGNMFSHNVDWAYKESRCPMHLVQIGEADERWPMEDDDNACAARISRYKTISLLHRVYQEIGAVNYQRLINKYEMVKNCGYSVKDFAELNEPLIRRLPPKRAAPSQAQRR